MRNSIINITLKQQSQKTIFYLEIDHSVAN